jgi:hypothetical protein
VIDAAGALGRTEALRDDPLAAERAGVLEDDRPVGLEMLIERDPVASVSKYIGEHGLAALDRLPPEVLASCFIRGSANTECGKYLSKAAIMAQRKKRATLRKRKSTARSQGGKTRKPTRDKAAKRTVAKSKPRKRLAKTMPKRTVAKKVAPKRARPVPPSVSTVETVTVDVIEEAAPGVITITEFEEREVREESPEQPEETPPESEER